MAPRVLLAFEPPDGGVAENVGQLAQGLGAHGWEVALAGPQEALPYAHSETLGGPIYRLPLGRGYGHPGADARALRGLLGLLRDWRPDLLHCHSSKAGVLGRVAARIAQIPVVYTPHCFPFVGDFGPLRRNFALGVERSLGRLGGQIICVCEQERVLAITEHIAPRERLSVVLNGSVPALDVQPDPVLEALRGDGMLVGAVAVLRAQKSLEVLVDAAPLLFARVPQARVAIVGDGPLREELHTRAARLGLDSDPRFAFLPFRPPAARALGALDLYVLPSSWEGLPIGVLEALACGVPQVVTDVGGSREAVGAGTGVLVAPHDPLALADAMAGLLEDEPRRAAMARASRVRHAAHFAVARMVEETAAVYDATLARSMAARSGH